MSSWQYDFRANGRPTTWKEAVGDFLRNMADRFDKRISIAVFVKTTPKLSHVVVATCIRRGLREARLAIELETKEAAWDRMFRKNHPELFEEKTDEKP